MAGDLVLTTNGLMFWLLIPIIGPALSRKNSDSSFWRHFPRLSVQGYICLFLTAAIWYSSRSYYLQYFSLGAFENHHAIPSSQSSAGHIHFQDHILIRCWKSFASSTTKHPVSGCSCHSARRTSIYNSGFDMKLFAATATWCFRCSDCSTSRSLRS